MTIINKCNLINTTSYLCLYISHSFLKIVTWLFANICLQLKTVSGSVSVCCFQLKNAKFNLTIGNSIKSKCLCISVKATQSCMLPCWCLLHCWLWREGVPPHTVAPCAGIWLLVVSPCWNHCVGGMGVGVDFCCCCCLSSLHTPRWGE